MLATLNAPLRSDSLGAQNVLIAIEYAQCGPLRPPGAKKYRPHYLATNESRLASNLNYIKIFII